MDLDPQLNRRSNYLSIKFLGYDLMPLDGGVQCNTSPFLAGCAYRKEVSLLQPRTDLQASGNSEMLEDVGSHHIQNAFGSQNAWDANSPTSGRVPEGLREKYLWFKLQLVDFLKCFW